MTDTLRRSAQDYSFGCDEVSRLARMVGTETGVPEKAYDLLDDFARKLPTQGSIGQVVESFSLMPRATGGNP